MRTTVMMLAGLLLSVPTQAQTDPRAQPGVSLSNLVYVGSFTAPATDGVDWSSAHQLDWGASGMGMGPDGQSLYIACHNQVTAYARISIPAIGQQARIIETCKQVNLSAINPTDPNSKKVGGLLAWNGRTIMSAYSYYDGGGTAVASHFADGAGPFKVGTMNPGFVGGYMIPVPSEWRGVLGGPALTGQCCLSTVQRTSYGPSVSVFDPDQVGRVTPVPAKMLLGYPDAHQTIGGFQSVGDTAGYGMATTIAGAAFIPGTSTVLFVGRQGTTKCYGTGTANKALHGTPDGQGNVYCYDPGNNDKGTHGFPYFEAVWGYNAGDLADVQAGRKQPWDVRPTFIGRLPSGLDIKCLSTATSDPATKRIYARGCGVGTTIFVWEIQVGSAPPTPIDCAGVWSETLSAPSPPACDASRVQTRTRTRTLTVVTPAANGGAACPASPVVTQETSACDYTPPPPPPPPTFVGRFASQATYTSAGVSGLRITLRVPAALPRPSVGTVVTLRVPLVGGTFETRTGKVRSERANAYSGGDGQVVVEIPGLNALGLELTLPQGGGD